MIRRATGFEKLGAYKVSPLRRVRGLIMNRKKEREDKINRVRY